MTGSDANYLAGLYGEGTSLQEFADLLPRGARIIDIASGLSNFGLALATLRSDISVVNLDIQYDKSEEVERLRQSAPTNVEYLAGDALNLPENLMGQFDYAFSYNFLSHVLRADKVAGRLAIEGALGLLKPNGSLFVGPTNAKAATKKRWDAHVIHKGGPDSAVPVKAEDVSTAVGLLSTPGWLRPVYDAMMNTGIGVYPRQRFQPDHKGIVLSRDGGNTLVSLASPKGLAMALRLGVQSVAELFRR